MSIFLKAADLSAALVSNKADLSKQCYEIENPSMDGKYAYPSSGEVIDVQTRKTLLTLTDEFYNNVASEKMVEVQFSGNKAARAGDQFGIGWVAPVR